MSLSWILNHDYYYYYYYYHCYHHQYCIALSLILFHWDNACNSTINLWYIYLCMYTMLYKCNIILFVNWVKHFRYGLLHNKWRFHISKCTHWVKKCPISKCNREGFKQSHTHTHSHTLIHTHICHVCCHSVTYIQCFDVWWFQFRVLVLVRYLLCTHIPLVNKQKQN